MKLTVCYKIDFVRILIVISLFFCINCTSGNGGNEAEDEIDPGNIYDRWELIHYSEWNPVTNICETGDQGATQLYWVIDDTGELTKYVIISYSGASEGGICYRKYYDVVIEENRVTVKDKDGKEPDKMYRFELNGDDLSFFDDSESVETCQEELQFSKVFDDAEFEDSIETCHSSEGIF